MFTNLISSFTKRVVHPAIDAKMRALGEGLEAEAKRLCPVDTGKLRASINFAYHVAEKRLILAADMPYAVMVEFGTRNTPARPFLRPALATAPRIWRGGLVGALAGGGRSIDLQFSNTPEKHVAGYQAHGGKRTRGARLKVGRGRFR